MGRRRRATPYFPPPSSLPRVAARPIPAASRSTPAPPRLFAFFHRPNQRTPSFPFFPFLPSSSPPAAFLSVALSAASSRLLSMLERSRRYNTSRTRCCPFTFFLLFPSFSSPLAPDPLDPPSLARPISLPPRPVPRILLPRRRGDARCIRRASIPTPLRKRGSVAAGKFLLLSISGRLPPIPRRPRAYSWMGTDVARLLCKTVDESGKVHGRTIR